jgi:YgiT-type zinc finger domain-containing protein
VIKGVKALQKNCHCGHMMNIKLRTVIFSNKVEIHNVPIYSCSECSSSEVYAAVKSDLTEMIGVLGKQPEKQEIDFNEVNELARIMHRVSDKENIRLSVEAIIEDRINQLLDLILLAQSVNDTAWISDIRKRLQQITECMISTYDVT